MDWTYVLVTLLLIAAAVTYIVAFIFFRRMYYVIEEIEARLIQIRDMIEAQDSKEVKKPSSRRDVMGQGSMHDTTLRG